MGGKRGCRYRVTGMDFAQIKNQVPPKLQILAKKEALCQLGLPHKS